MISQRSSLVHFINAVRGKTTLTSPPPLPPTSLSALLLLLSTTWVMVVLALALAQARPELQEKLARSTGIWR